jgi:hypothetical protein
MQKEVGVTDQEREVQRAFTNFEKNQALKILDDYSLETGRKWQAILSEILTVTKTDTSEKAPLLTRQDLEHWAARKSTLGDTKFKIVFDFLCHPETLARPEFSKAQNLTSFGAIKRTGHIFEEFFDDPEIFGLGRISLGKNEGTKWLDLFEGYFVGTERSGDHLLVLTRFPNSNFFVCHYIYGLKRDFLELPDWNMERLSGFATIGNKIRLHTKNVIDMGAYEMFLNIDPVDEFGSIDSVKIIEDTLISNSIANVAISPRDLDGDIFEFSEGDLNSIDLSKHFIKLKRTKEFALNDFVDLFRWNVVL